MGSRLEIRSSTTAASAKSDDTRVEVRTAIAGGFHNFIITEPEGRVFAFGLNEFGQLGLGTKAPNVKTPQAVPFFEARWGSQRGHPTITGKGAWLSPECGLIDLRCGAYHTVALCDDGLYVCGANDHGQLGLGHFDPVFSAMGFFNITPNIKKPSSSSSSANMNAHVTANVITSSSRSLLSTSAENPIEGERKGQEGTQKAEKQEKGDDSHDEDDTAAKYNCNDEADEWSAATLQTKQTSYASSSREKEGAIAKGKSATASASYASLSSASASSLASRLTTVGQIAAIRCGSYHTIVLVQNVPRTPEEEEASRARLLAALANHKKNGVCASSSSSSEGTRIDVARACGSAVDRENRSSRPQRREREERTLLCPSSSSFLSAVSGEQEELGKLIDRALQIAKREEVEQIGSGGEGQESLLLLRYFLNDSENAAAATIPCDSSSSSCFSSAAEPLSDKYSVFTCGKGDFGELGYDADEWDKLTAIEKRVKQNVANKAAYVANGGKEEEYLAAATAGQTGGFGIGMGGGGGTLRSSAYSASSSAAHASPFAKFKTTATKAPPPKPVRRPEFSSHTFRRVPFPLLDYGFYAHNLPTQHLQQGQPPTPTPVTLCTEKVRISGVQVDGHNHHTTVAVEYLRKIPAITSSSFHHILLLK